MAGYPGYNASTFKVESPVLFDVNTKIGRSVGLNESELPGSRDRAGTLVGTAGTLVRDSDMTILPVGYNPPQGLREIHTEVRDLDLTHFTGAAVRAGINLSPFRLSPGEVLSFNVFADSLNDLPAQSFFNLNVDADLPAFGSFLGATLTNTTEPLLVVAQSISSLPPSVVYIHANSSAVPVFFKFPVPGMNANAQEKFGELVLAGHGMQKTEADAPQFVAYMHDQVQEMPTSTQLPVPTLTGWGILALGALLTLSGFFFVWRRRSAVRL
jgi:hypothetical protein